MAEMAKVAADVKARFEKFHWTRFQDLIEIQSPNFVLGSQGVLQGKRRARAKA